MLRCVVQCDGITVSPAPQGLRSRPAPAEGVSRIRARMFERSRACARARESEEMRREGRKEGGGSVCESVRVRLGRGSVYVGTFCISSSSANAASALLFAAARWSSAILTCVAFIRAIYK